MHIGFLTPEYPHDRIVHSAGIGTSIKNLVVALVQKGVTVSVFVYGQTENAVFVDNGVKIHLIKNKKYSLFGWYFHRKHIQNYLNKHIILDKINLIEAPDWTGITAFMKFKIPLLIRLHGSDTYFCHLEKRKQKLKNYWFEKLAINKAVAFIAPTAFAGELSKKMFGIKSKIIKTISHGLELNKFQNPEPTHYQQGLILYIGTIIRKKGVLELPEIFNKVCEQFPEAKLVLIGADSGDIETKSQSTWQLLQQNLKEENKKNVSFLGKIPYQEIQEYLKNAHICVFPTYAETLGMVTIEAMAMQKPVVNSNIGWANEIIEDKVSGYLLHPSNHELFAQRICNLLKDEKQCAKMGSDARKRVENKFNISMIAVENIKFYQNIIANSLNKKINFDSHFSSK